MKPQSEILGKQSCLEAETDRQKDKVKVEVDTNTDSNIHNDYITHFKYIFSVKPLRVKGRHCYSPFENKQMEN